MSLQPPSRPHRWRRVEARLGTGAACCLLLALVLGGCVTGFTNAQRRLDSRSRTLFVPAVSDVSSRGGNSGRLSVAIRRALALDTRFQLVPIEEARWAVGMDLVNVDRRTETAAECAGSNTQANATVASLAFACKKLQEQLALAEVSSETESVGLDLRVRAVDLTSGATVLTLRYDASRRATFKAPSAATTLSRS